MSTTLLRYYAVDTHGNQENAKSQSYDLSFPVASPDTFRFISPSQINPVNNLFNFDFSPPAVATQYTYPNASTIPYGPDPAHATSILAVSTNSGNQYPWNYWRPTYGGSEWAYSSSSGLFIRQDSEWRVSELHLAWHTGMTNGALGQPLRTVLTPVNDVISYPNEGVFLAPYRDAVTPSGFSVCRDHTSNAPYIGYNVTFTAPLCSLQGGSWSSRGSTVFNVYTLQIILTR